LTAKPSSIADRQARQRRGSRQERKDEAEREEGKGRTGNIVLPLLSFLAEK
jgi:hypothetical protein